jgi:hypothetical protein
VLHTLVAARDQAAALIDVGVAFWAHGFHPTRLERKPVPPRERLESIEDGWLGREQLRDQRGQLLDFHGLAEVGVVPRRERLFDVLFHSKAS